MLMLLRTRREIEDKRRNYQRREKLFDGMQRCLLHINIYMYIYIYIYIFIYIHIRASVNIYVCEDYVFTYAYIYVKMRVYDAYIGKERKKTIFEASTKNNIFVAHSDLILKFFPHSALSFPPNTSE